MCTSGQHMLEQSNRNYLLKFFRRSVNDAMLAIVEGHPPMAINAASRTRAVTSARQNYLYNQNHEGHRRHRCTRSHLCRPREPDVAGCLCVARTRQTLSPGSPQAICTFGPHPSRTRASIGRCSLAANFYW